MFAGAEIVVSVTRPGHEKPHRAIISITPSRSKPPNMTQRNSTVAGDSTTVCITGLDSFWYEQSDEYFCLETPRLGMMLLSQHPATNSFFSTDCLVFVGKRLQSSLETLKVEAQAFVLIYLDL